MRKTIMSFLAVSLVFCFVAPLWGARKGGGDHRNGYSSNYKSNYKSTYKSSRDDDRSVRPRRRSLMQKFDPWAFLRHGFFGWSSGAPFDRENRIQVGDLRTGKGRVGRFNYDRRQIRCRDIKNDPILCGKAVLNLKRIERKRNYMKRVVDDDNKVLVPVRDMPRTGIPPLIYATVYDRRTGTEFDVVDRNYAKRWLGDSFDESRSERIKNDFYLGYTGRDFTWRRNVRGTEIGTLEHMDREIALTQAYLEVCCDEGLLGHTADW
jgi:hypothetical protein